MKWKGGHVVGMDRCYAHKIYSKGLNAGHEIRNLDTDANAMLKFTWRWQEVKDVGTIQLGQHPDQATNFVNTVMNLQNP
jgi:hypothetical protein